MTRPEPSSSNNLLPHLEPRPHSPSLAPLLSLPTAASSSFSSSCAPYAAKPLSLFLLFPFLSTRSSFSLSLSFPIRSFLTSLRSVLSMSVHFFFFLRSLCLCQAARFLRPAPLNPQGPLVDEGRFARFEYESCNYNRG